MFAPFFALAHFSQQSREKIDRKNELVIIEAHSGFIVSKQF
jgi:hypothetical protein